MSTELEDQLSDQLKHTPLAPPVGRRSAAEIEALAQSRSRHRVRLAAAATTLVVAVAAASSAAVVRHHDDAALLTDQATQQHSNQGQQTAGGTDPGSGGLIGPGCSGPWTNVVSVEGGTLSPPTDGFESSIIKTTVGTALVITSRIGPEGGDSFVHTLQFVVTPPGFESESPGPAENPANQLAASKVMENFVSDGQTLDLAWTPTEKGTFPMFGLVTESMSDDCSASPDGILMNSEDPLAVIVVD